MTPPSDGTRGYRLVFHLDGWTPPEDCPCEWRVEPRDCVIFMRCPVHGVDAGPTVGPPDWPPIGPRRVL